ncbi:MAG: hypothetical protein ABI175_24200 [Polyangiales bacterium]
MDLQVMLEKCRRDQWKVTDLDWTKKPRPMSKDDEIAIVQYFTDMAEIERLAGALFKEQERRVQDETLRQIFKTFIVDEIRHAECAQRLAHYYDVHHYREYDRSDALVKFAPHFLEGIRHLSDDVANAYITAGELMLDIALLRSIDDYVADGMSAQAMRLINRDESRHIAVDYHMVEYYASPAYAEKERQREAKAPARQRIRALRTFASVIYYAQPFFRQVFFLPMERVDPSGTRLREAIRRVQLLSNKPGVAQRPLGKFILGLQDLYHRPVVGSVFGSILSRLAGVEPQYLARLNDDAELERARAMTYEQMAEEALAVKEQGN